MSKFLNSVARVASSGPSCVMIGSIVHSLSFGELEVIQHGALIFNPDTGVLLENPIDLKDIDAGGVENDSSGKPGVISSQSYKELFNVDHVIDCGDRIIMPGLIDAHCHAPQYIFTGTGMDLPLLEWLEKYTFPSEAKFANAAFARNAYKRSVKRHLQCGTTFASYFATIHDASSVILAEVITECGQRAHVGKVSMDRNSPSYLIEDTTQGCKDAESFVREILSMTTVGKEFLNKVDTDTSNDGSKMNSNTLLNKIDTPRVVPCITPRFVPTCSSEMMNALSSISNRYGLPLQSHLSESLAEIDWVKFLHPECNSYGDVYHKHGMLHDFSYMAHCCHSDQKERDLLRTTGTGIVHCPSSNFMLGSGVLDVRQLVLEGCKVALGTDVAGGYSPSMLDAMRQAIIASRVKQIEFKKIKSDKIAAGDENAKNEKDYEPLGYKEAFYLATQAGADVLGMGDVVGNFIKGKKLDCLIVNGNGHTTELNSNFDSNEVVQEAYNKSTFDIFDHDELIEKFQKFLFLGDDRNIESIYVDGKKV